MPPLSTFRLAATLLLMLSPGGATAAHAQAIDTLALRTHTRYLASDQLAGRGTATEGERLAAAYIVTQLERLGLKPLGDNFLQPIPLHRVFVLPDTRVTVRRGADSASFQHGRDFVLAPGARDAYRGFAGETVLVGIADQAARVSATTLRGRVPVVFGSFSEVASLLPAWREAGVGGVILAIPDSAQFDFIARSRAADRFLVDADVDDPMWHSRMPAILVGPALLGALFSGTGLPSSLPDQPMALGSSVRADIVIRTEAAPASNVLAVLPGSDPALRNEYVVYTAHYDHLGIGPPDERGDTIYNGFSDNAAGVSMLLAIADALRASPPACSVAFLFFTGEERGLLG
ncbi:MAG: M28 family peptidase, partial [Longimicrobiales bacterium]